MTAPTQPDVQSRSDLKDPPNPLIGTWVAVVIPSAEIGAALLVNLATDSWKAAVALAGIAVPVLTVLSLLDEDPRNGRRLVRGARAVVKSRWFPALVFSILTWVLMVAAALILTRSESVTPVPIPPAPASSTSALPTQSTTTTDTSPAPSRTTRPAPTSPRTRPKSATTTVPATKPPTSTVPRTPDDSENPYAKSQQRVALAGSPQPSQWSNPSAATGTCDIEGGVLHARTGASSAYHECHSAVSADDVTVEARFRFATSDSAGVLVRAVGPGSWYFAQVSRDGTAYIGIASGGGDAPLDGGQTLVQGFDPAGDHVVALTAVGSTLTLFVDGHQVVRATDDRYRRGSVGVYSVSYANGKETTFSRVRVWR